MKRFAALFHTLDAANGSRHKQQALLAYLSAAPAEDAATACWLLAGGRPLRPVASAVLRSAAQSLAGLPQWLFDECYERVGDLAETIALLLPSPDAVDDRGLRHLLVERIMPLRDLARDQQVAGLLALWRQTDADCRLVVNKLITGAFRVGLSRQGVVGALADHTALAPERISQRLTGLLASRQPPDAGDWRALTAAGHNDEADALPFPFFLAHPLSGDPAARLGRPADWLAEWKWDGMRGQLVRRDGISHLWSRGGELVSDRFPELLAMAATLPPELRVDGEIIVWPADAERPLPFNALQSRINRKQVGRRLLSEAPACFVAYDLLAIDGEDLRRHPLARRRQRLEALLGACADPRLRLSEAIAIDDWNALAEARKAARSRGAEGLMLKRRESAYGEGRSRSHARGDWWKWKLSPMSVDAVLVHALRGHGRRAGLFTDYGFALWDRPASRPEAALVGFARAYSGLDDAEIRRIDAFIRHNTLERFGPVRTVRPELVMEIGFDAVAPSRRHKSGFAVRFPRILRVRDDKRVDQADTLADLDALMTAGRE